MCPGARNYHPSLIWAPEDWSDKGGGVNIKPKDILNIIDFTLYHCGGIDSYCKWAGLDIQCNKVLYGSEFYWSFSRCWRILLCCANVSICVWPADFRCVWNKISEQIQERMKRSHDGLIVPASMVIGTEKLIHLCMQHATINLHSINA